MVQTITRRAVLAGSATVASANGVLAGTVPVNADAELLHLGAALERAWEHENARSSTASTSPMWRLMKL